MDENGRREKDEDKERKGGVRNNGKKEGNPPWFVFLHAEPHPDRLLHLDAGTGSIQDLVLHCDKQKKRSRTRWELQS